MVTLNLNLEEAETIERVFKERAQDAQVDIDRGEKPGHTYIGIYKDIINEVEKAIGI